MKKKWKLNNESLEIKWNSLMENKYFNKIRLILQMQNGKKLQEKNQPKML